MLPSIIWRTENIMAESKVVDTASALAASSPVVAEKRSAEDNGNTDEIKKVKTEEGNVTIEGTQVGF